MKDDQLSFDFGNPKFENSAFVYLINDKNKKMLVVKQLFGFNGWEYIVKEGNNFPTYLEEELTY